MQTTATLYETDYASWVAETVTRLHARDFAGVDLDHLIEEVESLGSSERHALASQWIRVVKHLLKLSMQPETTNYHNSWVSSVVEGLDQLSGLLKNSPSLWNYITVNQAEWYQRARKGAAMETRLAQANFPASCPYDLEQLLDGIFPESVRYFFEPD